MLSTADEVPSGRRHFGVALRQGSIHGFRIDRATYTNVSRSVSDPYFYLYAIEKGYLSAEEAARMFVDSTTCRQWTEEYASERVQRALRNFDLNMIYFSRVDWSRFQAAISGLLEAFPEFQPVTDLNPWMEKKGLYLLVLDDYRQVYLGQSVKIGRRIRQHWSSSKRLDRLIFGSAEGSILSIDSFRALDTTRIYAWSDSLGTQRKRDASEKKVVAHMDPELSLNRIAGGEGYAAMGESVREGGLKQRVLEATDEEWAEYLARLDQTPMGREIHPRGWRRPPQRRKRKPLSLIVDANDDPIGVLVREANGRKQSSTILVDAGGTILEVCEGAVPQTADKYIQLFVVPCGRSISREMMERALGHCKAFIGRKPAPPIELFERLGRSGIALRLPRNG